MSDAELQECFVLGCELCKAANEARIRKAMEKANRAYRIGWMEGDVSESWMTLEVLLLEAKR